MASNGWEKFYGKGENSNGFRSVNPNGVASDSGTGCNRDYHWGPNVNGERWAMPDPNVSENTGSGPFPCAGDQGTTGYPQRRRSKNMNRTGE